MLHLTDTPRQLLLDNDFAPTPLATPDLASLVEALLLVATEPPTIEDIADVANVDPSRVVQAIDHLAEDTGRRGWMVQVHGRHLHLVTSPRFSRYISDFLGLEREGKLSVAALEALAIVAYRQPVTRSEIESVRGVDCSGVLSTLHARELIEPVSRLSAIGNPFQYGTTAGFLRLFGLASLADLPPLGQFGDSDTSILLEQVVTAANVTDAKEKEPSAEATRADRDI